MSAAKWVRMGREYAYVCRRMPRSRGPEVGEGQRMPLGRNDVRKGSSSEQPPHSAVGTTKWVRLGRTHVFRGHENGRRRREPCSFSLGQAE